MKKDLVIGIVGTLILLTAMVGVFRYEASQRGASFDLTWATRTVEASTVEGGTNEGESSQTALNLTQANITQVEFVLEWTDNQANTAPDEFNLTVTSPSGRTYSASGDSGRVSIVVSEGLAAVPQEARLLGSDESAARDQATRQFSSAAGTGTWNVTVALVQAGDTATPAGPVPVPQLQDGGNDWTLRPVLTVYEASLSPA